MEQEEMTQTARLPRWRKEVRSQEMQMTSKSSWRWGKGFYLEFPEEKRPSNTSVSSVLKCEWQCYLPVGLVGMIKWVTVRETHRSGADTQWPLDESLLSLILKLALRPALYTILQALSYVRRRIDSSINSRSCLHKGQLSFKSRDGLFLPVITC